MQSKPVLQNVLILEPDPLRGAMIAQSAKAALPGASVHLESVPAEAAAILAEQDVALFIVTLHGFDLDILTLLGVWAEHAPRRTRVLVVTPDANSSAIMALGSLPIHGIVDLRQTDFQELERAFRVVLSGATYRSRSAMAKWPALEVIRCGSLVPSSIKVDLPEVTRRFHRRFEPPRN